ncbi:hypothetical protein JCM6882_001263 [Rhodosporidiobolus microsporus]
MGNKEHNPLWRVGRGGSFVCDCRKAFSSKAKLFRHFARSDEHNYCEECELDFPTPAGLRSHFANSKKHHFCTLCDDDFDDDEDLQEHKDEEHAKCEACGEYFKSEIGRYEHARQTHVDSLWFCEAHQKMFATETNWKAHMASALHAPLNFPCPASCGTIYVSRSALILHLESGTCKSGLDCRKVDQYITLVDPLCKFANPWRFNRPQQPAALTAPHSHAPGYCNSPQQAYQRQATSFPSLQTLGHHLPSASSPRTPYHYSPTPANSQNLQYRCPALPCQRPFTALSRLAQHIELEACGAGLQTEMGAEMARLLDAVVVMLVKLAV